MSKPVNRCERSVIEVKRTALKAVVESGSTRMPALGRERALHGLARTEYERPSVAAAVAEIDRESPQESRRY